MATVAEVTVKVNADLAPLRAALNEAKKETKAFDSAAEKAARNHSNSFKKSAEEVKKSAEEVNKSLSLTTQQLLGMQYQLNDIFVSLTSGQNPFIVMTQQGAQLSQMFGPGTGVLGAAKALGSGIVTFLTNPLNIAVLGIAAVAGAVPLIWDAINGEKAQSSKKALQQFDNLIEKIGQTSEETANKIKAMVEVPQTWSALYADAASQITSETGKMNAALKQFFQEGSNQSQQLFQDLALINQQLAEGFGTTTVPPGLVETREELIRIGEQLQTGQIDAAEAYEKLNKLRTAETTPPSLFNTIDLLRKVASEASNAFNKIQALGTLNPGQVLAQNNAAYEAAKRNLKETIENPNRIGTAFKAFEPAKSSRGGRKGGSGVGGGSSRSAEQMAENTQYIADLEREVQLMQLGYGERQKALEQFEIEKQVRDEIRQLGEEATPAQIAAIQRLIPLQHELNEAIREEERARREAKQFGKEVMKGFITDMREGKSAAEALSGALNKIADKLLEIGLNAIFNTNKGGGASGGGLGGLFGGLISKLFGGAFAEGGMPPMNKVSVVGERGPELFVPSTRGMIVPNRNISLGSNREQSIQIELITNTNTGVITEIADSRIKSAAPTIVKASVTESQKQTQKNMPGYMSNAQQRSF